MKRELIDYACAVERPREEPSVHDKIIAVFKTVMTATGFLVMAYIVGFISGLYAQEYAITQKIVDLQTEKQKLCTQLYGPESTVVDGMCAMKNGRVVRK